ncbi:MAG: hypothetical protein Q7T11_07110 [Deltaproteobacteria bacterium]|nr:hypothetical protein [Deltaproteobacteria bacterium]
MATRVTNRDKQQADIADQGAKGMAAADKAHAETTGAVGSAGSVLSTGGDLAMKSGNPYVATGGLVAKLVGEGTKVGAATAGASRKGITGAEAAGLAATTAGSVAGGYGAVDKAPAEAPKAPPKTGPAGPATVELAAGAPKPSGAPGRGSSHKPAR